MGLNRKQTFHLLGVALLLGLFCSEPRTGYGMLDFSWCPPEEFACTCSLNEGSTEGETGNEIPMMISCDTSNIKAIISSIPGHLASDLELHVALGAEDQVLSSSTFLNFSKLSLLDLSENSLKQLQAGALHNAVELTVLTLSQNFLSGLASGMFSGVLEVGDSTVQYGLPKLKELRLDNNDIAFISDDVFEDLLALRFLDLSGNRISEISNFTFSGLRSLTILHLAGNFLQLTNSSMWGPLRNLRELNLSDNQIGEVVPDSFKELPHLETLRLDRNRIDEMHDPGLEIPSVNKLNLSHNSISHLSFSFFHPLSQNMTWINLDNNLLTKIDYGSWSSSIIQELYLNDNDLGNIANAFLWGIPELKHLEMKNNRIQSIAQYMFGDLLSLEVVNLDGNEISYLQADIFDVEYDPRQRFQLPAPTALKKLYINNNRLSYPCRDIIEHMFGMQIYSMNHNLVRQLHSFHLPEHEALADIDLSMNEIYSIAKDTFANLPALQRVNLKGNELQTLSRDVFTTLPSFLLLGGNPLVCDCNLVWLQEPPFDAEEDLKCAAPKALESMSVSSLDMSEFHCSIEVNVNTSNEFSGVHGQGVLLECPVMSASRANVRWFVAAYNHTSREMVLEDVTKTGDRSAAITSYPNGSLYIHTILHEQNTNYTCRATNNVDERDFFILLRVEGYNGTAASDGRSGKGGEDGYKIWKTEIMKYALGGATGAVFLIGLISILLAFFLSSKRLQKTMKTASRDSFEKELPVNNKQFGQSN